MVKRKSRNIIDFIQKNRFVSILGTLAVLFFFLGIASLFILSDRAENDNVQIIPSGMGNEASASGIYVDLAGAVQKPGLYHLPADSRIHDLIKAAGGLTVNADQTYISKNINLAQKLQDGIKIYIPSMATQSSNVKGQSIGNKETSGVSYEGKVNINMATLDELDTLPGIGPATAQKIIDYRENNGTFWQIEDIKNVSGIGDKTFEEIKELITVY